MSEVAVRTAPRPSARTTSFRRLAAARMTTQAIGVAWLLIAVRHLSENEFGVLSTGLGAFGILTVLGDGGVTWSLPRVVVEAPERAWSAYLAALRLRVPVGVAAGIVGVSAYLLFGNTRLSWAVVLGAAIAVTSGVTETGFVTLRSVGRARLETVALPMERIVFLGAGTMLLVLHASALHILALYLATNAATALVTAVAVRCLPRDSAKSCIPPLWSRTTLLTAVAFAMLSLAPRLTLVLLSLSLSESAVGAFALGARPVEQVAWAAVGLSVPFLPAMHEIRMTDGDEALHRFAVALCRTLFDGLFAVAAVLVFAAPVVIEIMAGDGRFSGASGVLTVLAMTALLWPMRAVLGFVLLASERPGQLVRAGVIPGVVAPVAAALVAQQHGLVWVAGVLAAGEVVGVTWIARLAAIRFTRPRSLTREGLLVATAIVAGLLLGHAGLLVGLIAVAGRVALGVLLANNRYRTMRRDLLGAVGHE